MPKAKPTKKATSERVLPNCYYKEYFGGDGEALPPRGKRKLSPYNAFMKSELPKVKAENPDLEHKAAFKLVAERWKNSPDNPKNQTS
ncbi:6868_t:CDS:2 [Funneliformis caledonium]|uniref:6868_t:CDS:1 n=1 Tax=Funneliformis caledonium TaxID=1117310 RepID=A0A9N9AJD4_9GLOM|nr:6868_t:CDS:2 [Funneliformis caledonium]